MSSLSVIIPTLNCAEVIPAHLASLAPWADLAAEIVVVDSHSSDGTPELIRDHLRHPGVRLLDHPRGLYQSWNHGIANTTGSWIYISTVGDSITKEQLVHLWETGEAMQADVVISPPTFKFADGVVPHDRVWPIERILRDHGITRPTALHPVALFFHVLNMLPESYLGSSASNLYRGEHLRARPFPTDYGVVGDTAWSIRHAFDSRHCFTPRTGSEFLYHEKAYAAADFEARSRIELALLGLARRTFAAAAPEAAACARFGEFMDLQDALQRAKATYGNARQVAFPPWFLSPQAWRAKAARNRLRPAVRLLAEALREQILKLPADPC
jgi:glycosyltransferase involved in cell wall biosynthesis